MVAAAPHAEFAAFGGVGGFRRCRPPPDGARCAGVGSSPARPALQRPLPGRCLGPGRAGECDRAPSAARPERRVGGEGRRTECKLREPWQARARSASTRGARDRDGTRGSPRSSEESRNLERELLVARMLPQRKQGGAGSRGARRKRETRHAAEAARRESARGGRRSSCQLYGTGKSSAAYEATTSWM
jgi:hypothetical protein